MALLNFKRDDYFFNLWCLLFIVNRIIYVYSTNPEHHQMHREFCVQKKDIDTSVKFVKTSSLLNCATSCKANCEAIWFRKDNGKKECDILEKAQPKPNNHQECTDPKMQVSFYLKRKVSQLYTLIFFESIRFVFKCHF